MNKLAIFDIDGTIAVHGTIPQSIVRGFEHIQSLGFLTTVSTGRSYVRMKEALGEHFDTIISPDSLIIIEQGSKIVDPNGAVIRADYFQPNEIEHVVAFSRSNIDMIKLLWFTSPDSTQPVQVWCKRPEDLAAETAKRGHYADVFHCSFDELHERLSEYPVSNVSAKLEDFIRVENLKLHFTRSEIDTIFQDSMMEFVRNISDKAKAIRFLETHHDIEIKDMLVAGNAINDVDMLNLQAGRRILVGDSAATEIIVGHLRDANEVTRVDSPEKLGVYLQGLSD
jgi:HAD superfamily hydrolase (TIGR01484 family)